jgi:NitT/TauT family transport system substrate-binding protein
MFLARMARWTQMAVGVTLFAACTGERSKSPSPDASTPLAKIRVRMSPHLSWAPVFIALEEGDFRREGLDVELVPTMRSEESLVALVTGDLDVRPGPLSSGLLSAIAQGAPIRVVAGMGVLDPAGCTYYGIVARRDLDTTGTPAVHRIRASEDGASRYVVDRMLAQRGLPLPSLETIRLPDAVATGSLGNGAVDLAAISEPALRRVSREHPLWLSGERAVPNFQWAVIAYSERLWKRQPDLGHRFMRAYRRGLARYAEGKTARNVDIVARATNEDPDIIRDACWLSMPTHARITWPTIDAFQLWANSQGLMERRVTEAQVWDSTFVHASDR